MPPPGFPDKSSKDPEAFAGRRPPAEAEELVASPRAECSQAVQPWEPQLRTHRHSPSRAFSPRGAGVHPAPLRKVTLWMMQTPFRFPN